MNIFELEIWNDECRSCTFYTVKNDSENYNETDKFLLKYSENPEYEEDAQTLLSFIIYSIGDEHGAIDELFNRYENEVTGLPSKGKISLGELTYHYPSFSLRLYALKITDEIVILFNGGIKDGPTNQTSSLNIKWIEACNYAKRILQALKEGEFQIDVTNRKLISHKGDNEIIL